MTRQFGTSDAAPRPANATDVFVILTVTVLSLAAGAWLLAQFGVAIWGAMIGALTIYAVLLSIHLVARRSLTAAARPAAYHEPEQDIDWQESPGHVPRTIPGLPHDAFHTGRYDTPPSGHGVHGAGTLDWDMRPPSVDGIPAHNLPEARALPPFNFRPMPAPALELPDTDLAMDMDAAAVPRSRDVPRFDAGAPADVTVEVIQSLIKKLADELNAPLPPEHQPDQIIAAEPETMISRSVAALETTARGMRVPPVRGAAPRQEMRQPAGGVPSWWPVATEAEVDVRQSGAAPTKRPPTLNPQLARIAEAVAAERMEVLLEPIQALAEGRTRHFEVSMRLLTADGATLEQCDFARAAHGSGLMPQIDAERMIRAARIARRLGDRGRQGSLLSAIAGESLADAGFLGTATSHGDSRGRMTLVLSFAQSEVRNFTAGHSEALSRLAAAGYGFALEDVTDLDMDFGALKAMGFEFVKLDAPVFLEGLAAPAGNVPAADICRHLSDYGLTVIVGRIEDDALLAQMLNLGVAFGKGALFGGPKLVKPEVVAAAA